ncbi:hypothetical protein Phi19:2_gp003 [Cellulophaga phage phi19:2]|uniref:Uncharacterized protein n=3 Tax=Cellulophaga phage phiST TaxID=756282 RepID=M4SPX3_9CAUD|nr:hypothetical protein CGPG_00103 [Cellulophaga phage phiST]AGH56801.1 hypothetical protein CGPG_00103 [Cellulophaga phage phiST]AGO47142.1 hypothetical protein PhiST_gp003 [Cellulophaga phage phiST]AGO48638.1 hypothetical protein Phi19:2_gp003 [Cellulophaga phage phi19:2]AGO49014.1 hypothetical protein Phi13:1_gp003 [Cellulophaga phage phi13:1]
MSNSNSMQPSKMLDLQFDPILLSSNYVMTELEECRFGGGDSKLYIGTGLQIRDRLKEIFGFDEWKEEQEEDNEDSSWEAFVAYLIDLNGDGYSYVQIFKLQ